MPERFGQGEFEEASKLPAFQQRLHRRQMRAAQQQRQPAAEDFDESGRPWPGLVTPNTIEKE